VLRARDAFGFSTAFIFLIPQRLEVRLNIPVPAILARFISLRMIKLFPLASVMMSIDDMAIWLSYVT